MLWWTLHRLNSSNPRARQAAKKELWNSSDPRVVKPLLELLQHGSTDERKRTAKELGKFQDTRAVSPLIQALKDKDPYVRRSAAVALGAIRDSRAIEPLIEGLADVDSEVAGTMALALGKFGGTALARLSPNDRERLRRVAKVCQNCSKPYEGIYSKPPHNVCFECWQAIQKEVVGHKGPWCRSCGALYWSTDQLPRKEASYDDQLQTTYCPRCKSEKVY